MSRENIKAGSAEPKNVISLYEILGPPPLVRGESAAVYNAFAERIRTQINPTDIFEELWVRDLADLSWDILRYRLLKAKLFRVSEAESLDRLLYPDNDPRDTAAFIEGWMRRDADVVRNVKRRLAGAVLDEGAIAAVTLEVKLTTFESFDRQIMQFEARRNAVLREIDRHREFVPPRLPPPAVTAEDAAFEEVMTVSDVVK
jgi:hypothetical protein